jgi:hypothetical protein
MAQQTLVLHADSELRWAFPVGITACQAIVEAKMSLEPTECLSRFVSSVNRLDGLYIEVLHQAFDEKDDTVMSRFKLVMGRILATKKPLSICAHSEL